MRVLPKWKKAPVNYSSSWNIVSTEQELINDRVMNKSVVKRYDPAKENAKWRVSDFYLENLQAAGADGILKPRQYSDVTLDSVDVLDINIEDTFAAVDAAAAENKTDE